MEQEERGLEEKAAKLCASGVYEAFWQQERQEAMARPSAGRRMELPESVMLMGEPWNMSSLTPLDYNSSTKDRETVLIDIHGGGFVEGTPWADDALCAWLHEKTGFRVVALDYRKAPAFAYPTPLYDIAAQIAWMQAKRFIVMGHSAGANLAAAYCILAGKKELPMPCGQLLNYPYLDLAVDCEKRPVMPEAIAPLVMEVFRQAYVRQTGQRQESLVSPVFASQEELYGLPPTFLVTCGRDSLCPEGERYGAMLKQAGVPVEHIHCANACHAFIEHTFNTYSRFPVKDEQKKLAMELMPALVRWLRQTGRGANKGAEE